MAKVFDYITKELQEFIRKQRVFFVASAPLSPSGHVNLSPKGLDGFRVLSENCVAYSDLTGSGNETSAHLKENGRITFMFCAMTDSPTILRLYGKGNVVLPGDAEWDDLYSVFPKVPGTRQIVVADIHRVQTSCGFGVPLYEFQGERKNLVKWADKKGEQGLKEYREQKNMTSIDGLATHLSE